MLSFRCTDPNISQNITYFWSDFQATPIDLGDSIVKRLLSHDGALPLPRLRLGKELQTLPKCDIAVGDREKLKALVSGCLNTISKFSESFTVDCLEYNAVLCSLMDQVPNLYANDEIEVVSTVSCGGSTGPKGQKFGCAGAATIVHKYRQATKKEVVEHKLSKFRESLTNVTQRLAQPISHEVGVAVTTLENVVVLVVKLLEFHSRDSRSGHFCKFLLLSLNLLCFFLLVRVSPLGFF